MRYMIALLMINACGHECIGTMTNSGICIINIDRIDTTTDEFDAIMIECDAMAAEYYGQDVPVLDVPFSIEIVADIIDCDNYEAGCAGILYAYSDYEMVLVQGDTWLQTALYHELVHYYQYAYHGVRDFDHTSIEFDMSSGWTLEMRLLIAVETTVL
jgi:hypothetical protein